MLIGKYYFDNMDMIRPVDHDDLNVPTGIILV